MHLINRILLVSLSLPLLGACAHPSALPRGYSSFEEPYKSAPGPEAMDLGYDYSNDMNKTILEDMRFAATDLVERLDEKLSFSVDEIYLRTQNQNAFYRSFDHLLREELTHQGYLLTNDPSKGSVVVTFFAAKANLCDAQEHEDRSAAYKKLHLALILDTAQDENKEVVHGLYEVPAYGYIGSDLPSVESWLTGGRDLKLALCNKEDALP